MATTKFRATAEQIVYQGVSYPAGRYGRRRRASQTPRWLVPLLIGGAAVAGTALAWNTHQAYHKNDIQPQVVAFRAVSPALLEIEFRVQLEEEEQAVCIVRARSADGAETGRAKVTIPSGPAGERTIRYELATDKKAVTGEVQNCIPQQP